MATFSEVGDWSAPRGSAGWTQAVRLKVATLYLRVVDQENELGHWVAALQETKGWQTLLDPAGQPFSTWEAFCVEPIPYGLGVAAGDLAAEVERRSLAQKLAANPAIGKVDTRQEAGAKGGRGNKASNNVTSFRGNAASYLVRRIKRKAPEIATALAEGKYRSAREAARAAGISLQDYVAVVADNPEKALRRLVKHYGRPALEKAWRSLSE